MQTREMVPNLRFKEFKTPWKNILFKDICSDFSYGIGASAKAYDGSNKYLRITDIDEESNMFSPNPLTSPDGEIEDKYRLKTGDIVFARTGASVGKSYLYNEKDGNLIFAGFLIKASIKDGVPDFVFQSTLTKKYRNWVHVFSMRSGQPGINAQEYSSYKLSLPKIEEQQKIASFLSSIDEKISQLEKKKTLLETYKRGIMHKIFSQQLRFKDENGREFPEWEEKKIRDVADINPKSNGLPSQFTYIDLESVKNGKLVHKKKISIEKAPSRAQRKLILGDILYQSVRPYQRNNYHFKSKGDYVASTGYIQLREKFKTNYLYHIIHDDRFVGKVLSLCTGSNYPTIGPSDFGEIKVNFPDIDEQKKIALFLSSIDMKIEITSTQLEKTREFKKGLLQQMFV